MQRKTDIVIIGAGSAGLYALGQVQHHGRDFVLIDRGPLGTTCARVGCMPSKALIQIAEDFHRRGGLAEAGVMGGDQLRLDLSQALSSVRSVRDLLVSRVLAKRRIREMGDRFIPGSARLLGPNLVGVGDQRIQAERIIVAAGSRPVLPPAWEPYKRCLKGAP